MTGSKRTQDMANTMIYKRLVEGDQASPDFVGTAGPSESNIMVGVSLTETDVFMLRDEIVDTFETVLAPI